MNKIITFIIACGIMGVGFLISGTVLSFMWEWFCVPLLSLPPLSILEATAIGLTFSFVGSKQRHRKPTQEESLYMLKQGYMVKPLIVLISGYIIKTLLGL